MRNKIIQLIRESIAHIHPDNGLEEFFAFKKNGNENVDIMDYIKEVENIMKRFEETLYLKRLL